MLNTQNQELLQAIGCMVGEKLETCFTEYDARLDAKLDARFAEYDARLDVKLDARFAEYDAKLDAKLEARFAEYDAKLDARRDFDTCGVLCRLAEGVGGIPHGEGGLDGW